MKERVRIRVKKIPFIQQVKTKLMKKDMKNFGKTT
jgi:hypothetical protein